jgi:hypothetical protein
MDFVRLGAWLGTACVQMIDFRQPRFALLLGTTSVPSRIMLYVWIIWITWILNMLWAQCWWGFERHRCYACIGSWRVRYHLLCAFDVVCSDLTTSTGGCLCRLTCCLHPLGYRAWPWTHCPSDRVLQSVVCRRCVCVQSIRRLLIPLDLDLMPSVLLNSLPSTVRAIVLGHKYTIGLTNNSEVADVSLCVGDCLSVCLCIHNLFWIC